MRSPHVLIVEDDESLGLALVDAFERDGYRVDHVIDGREALERGLARRFDLIVLDLMLPGMDGYEVCKRLRAAGRDSPILMLTARGREEDRVHGLDLGADDYLCKPFSLRELLARARARVPGRLSRRLAHPDEAALGVQPRHAQGFHVKHRHIGGQGRDLVVGHPALHRDPDAAGPKVAARGGDEVREAREGARDDDLGTHGWRLLGAGVDRGEVGQPEFDRDLLDEAHLLGNRVEAGNAPVRPRDRDDDTGQASAAADVEDRRRCRFGRRGSLGFAGGGEVAVDRGNEGEGVEEMEGVDRGLVVDRGQVVDAARTLQQSAVAAKLRELYRGERAA